MIPLRDTIPSKRVPLFTYSLIAINLAIFIWELSLGPGGEGAILAYAFVPARVFGSTSAEGAPLGPYLSIFSSMFLHGGWLHLLGNMLYLFIFGDNVEDAFGHVGFLAFYLVCGVLSALTQGLFDPFSKVPMVGASGAVAGVLGAYFVLYPNARVLTLIPIFIFIQMVEIPAFFFLLFWFLFQFVSGALSSGIGASDQGGIAFWAHVGGFAAGLLVALAVRVSRAARSGARSSS